MRVFAAVPLTPSARLEVADTVDGLEIPGRLVPPENWHITLRFLGWVDEVSYEKFLFGLGELARHRPFRVRLGVVGAFPNKRRASVVWVGIEHGHEGLSAVAEVAEEAAVGAGLPPEERPFRPHLTLSRVRPPSDVAHLEGLSVPVAWRCRSVVVYRSVTSHGGSRYEPLETFRLGV